MLVLQTVGGSEWRVGLRNGLGWRENLRMVVGVMGLATEARIALLVTRFFGVDAVRGIFAFGDEWREL